MDLTWACGGQDEWLALNPPGRLGDQSDHHLVEMIVTTARAPVLSLPDSWQREERTNRERPR